VLSWKTLGRAHRDEEWAEDYGDRHQDGG